MKKGIYYTVLAVLLTAAVFILPIVNSGYTPENDDDGVGKSSHTIADESKTDSSSPEVSIPKSDETVTFLVRISGGDLIDAMNASGKSYGSIREYLSSPDSREAADTIKKNQAVVKASIRRIVSGADFDGCFTYNTVFNGFSLRAPYSLLPKLLKLTDVVSVSLVNEKNMHTMDNEETPSADETNETSSVYEETSDTSKNDEDPGDSAEESAPSPQITEEGQEKGILLSDAVQTRREDISETEDALSSPDTVIAVIDDGFSLDNETLTYYPQGSSAGISGITAPKAALSGEDGIRSGGKILFAYDYAGRDTDTVNPSSEHGTQTASLIAGLSGDGQDGRFGVAAESRLILMKVCRDGENTAPDDVLLAALDDAAKLSPDMINISMGASGLNNNDDIFTPVYSKLAGAGIMLTAAAGNDGVLSSGDTLAATLTDYGTVSYPSSLSCVLSSGSFDSSKKVQRYLAVGSQETVFSDQEGGISFRSFEGGEFSYITDLEAFAQETGGYPGRVLIARVNEDNAEEFAQSASDSAAAGIITIGSPVPLPEDSGMYAAVIGEDILPYLEKHTVGRVSYRGMRLEKNENAGQPSDFSSYGASPDLTLKPDILSAGTDIAAASGDGYSFTGGTSSSSALTAGAAAVILNSLPESVRSKDSETKNNIARAMLMNNAGLIKSGSLFLSPRVQGAGMLDIEKSADADCTLMFRDLSSVSLGYSADGSYRFTLTLCNFSEEDRKFSLSSALTTDRIYRKAGMYLNSLEPEKLAADVSFTYDGKTIRSVTVPSEGSAEIEVSISLPEDVLSEHREKAENGFYIDGYIFAGSLHIPLSGFCGDLTDAELFDSTVYDGAVPAIGKGSLVATAASGSAYPAYTLGQNITTGIYNKNRICIGRDTVKNFTEDSSAGVSFIMPNMYLLRNTDDFTIEINDKKGEQLYCENIGKASPYTDTNGEPYLWLLSGFNSDGLKNLFSTLTEDSYHIRLSARPVAASQSAAAIGFDFTVDNTAPTGLTSKTYIKEDRIYLDLHAADLNGVQGFLLYTANTGGKKYSYADRLDKLISQGYLSNDCCTLVNVSGDETTALYTYDITDLYRQLMRLSGYTSSDAPLHAVSNMIVFRAVDYAYNISAPSTARTLPEHSIEAEIKDGEGRPVKGAVISDGIHTAVSDKNGKASFSDPAPGMYAITLVSLPEGCETDFTLEAVNVTGTSGTITVPISVKRDPDFVGESEEESSAAGESISDDKRETSEKPSPSPLDPLFAFAFVGALVIISSVTLIITRSKRR